MANLNSFQPTDYASLISRFLKAWDSPYALKIKAEFEPPSQALIVVDREGIRQNTAIQLASGLV